ncbi:helix-turn-helix domain-containing protein [Dietzia sp. 179-F 9C3 NHS]|uniref:helix-turn-helix domain-containing protein n=1 Tax=Dietzia sp. 179-F 9C3 NHS TaxID=3374295 RepID=UPI00387917B8
MPANKAQRRLSSITDAAVEYGVHHSTIRRYISAGRITGYRFGPRMLRVDLDELDALLRPLATAKRGA